MVGKQLLGRGCLTLQMRCELPTYAEGAARNNLASDVSYRRPDSSPAGWGRSFMLISGTPTWQARLPMTKYQSGLSQLRLTNCEPDLGLTNHFRLLEISSPLASNEDVLASISIELTSRMPDRHSTMQLEIRLWLRRPNSGI